MAFSICETDCRCFKGRLREVVTEHTNEEFGGESGEKSGNIAGVDSTGTLGYYLAC